MTARRPSEEDYSQAKVYMRQTDELIASLNVNISNPKSNNEESLISRLLSTYEKLKEASEKATPVAWERTLADGRNGDEMMRRVWALREELLIAEKLIRVGQASD